MRITVRLLISTLASVAMIVGFTTSSQASQASTTAASSDAESCSVQGPTTGSTTNMAQVELGNHKAHDLTKVVSAAVKNGEIATHAPQKTLSLERAKVYNVDTDDGPDYTSVTVPIGGDYSMVSNLTVVFDDNGEITQSGETLISENAAGNFNISNFTDGELVKSNDTDRPFMSDAQLKQDDAGMKTMGVGSTVACVATVLGASGATAYLIVGACTIPVAGTAICVACIGAYATVGGASVSAVASCF